MWQKVRQFLHQWLPISSDQQSEPGREIHELLVRSPEDMQAHQQWKHQGGEEDFTDRLRHAYNVYRAGMDPEDTELDFMEFRTSSGFIIHLKDDESAGKEAPFIMDGLRDKILASGYRQTISERRIIQRKNRKEILERYYLKPPMDHQPGGAADQRFGNITIELLSCGQYPCNLKFITTAYPGRAHKPACSFGELMELLIA
ncbi:MAG: hypothetical protein K9I85_11090 [Saprospiraceae bacterium]|nr:hypothetical protein [Saprospiraceae bacterium]